MKICWLARICMAGAALAAVACGNLTSNDNANGDGVAKEAIGQPSPDQVPLDPTTIPQFVTPLPILPTYAPTLIRNSSGQIIRAEYTITDSQTTQQMLPSGFPATTVLAMGGNVLGGGTFQGAPGAVFENVRGLPTVVHWRTNVQQPHFLPIDPTIHWADPLAIEKPTPAFNLFPPGYPKAQFPVAHVTHTHGLMVLPQMDGTAEEWFTNVQFRGPSFVTEDYTMPNDQPSTQLFYHDHVMGATRIGVYSGEVGAAYFIRDPHSPLDRASSPLPRGAFEIPLTVFTRQFFTDGEVAFPPDRGSLTAGDDAPDNIAYWTYDEGSDVVLVNGAAWPNLNVQPRQYRFRMLMAGNTELFDFTLANDATGQTVPFTIIGSDGGYLPAPQLVADVQLGITERADILVDFSQFSAGTTITMHNTRVDPSETLANVMRFTVQRGTPVTPPALSASLFPARPALTTNAPTRFKVLRTFSDLKGADDTCGGQSVNCNQRSLDGLEFTSPPTEYPEIGSTEEWDLIHTGGGDDDDPDHRFHQIHIHLLEFQVLNRQPFDSAAYLRQWHLVNGHMPVSRPIFVDPAPFFTGPAVPPLPYETGWKDTVEAAPDAITRIVVRWAPQETPSNGVQPGQNLFSVDPSSFPDDVTGPGYVWHCHILGHEDHDMMRPLAVVRAWAPNTNYRAGNVIAFNSVDYRARVAHRSDSGDPPNTRFDLWARVNNNDGSWQPQIIYAANDRVLYRGQLFAALAVHQSQRNQPPPSASSLWQPLPMTACGQLAQFCQANSNPVAVQCRADGQAGNESTCSNEIEPCLSFCQPQQATPCSGLCNNPARFSVADGSEFDSGNLGNAPACFETTSRLIAGSTSGFGRGQRLTLNGRLEPLDDKLNYPLPPLRNDGYCIQTTGQNAGASFSVR